MSNINQINAHTFLYISKVDDVIIKHVADANNKKQQEKIKNLLTIFSKGDKIRKSLECDTQIGL